uniref:Cellulose synthase n=1 Tax=Lingulaulax polyedra TaxID=160621 RepID=A0AAU7YNC6_LINPO
MASSAGCSLSTEARRLPVGSIVCGLLLLVAARAAGPEPLGAAPGLRCAVVACEAVGSAADEAATQGTQGEGLGLLQTRGKRVVAGIPERRSELPNASRTRSSGLLGLNARSNESGSAGPQSASATSRIWLQVVVPVVMGVAAVVVMGVAAASGAVYRPTAQQHMAALGHADKALHGQTSWVEPYQTNALTKMLGAMGALLGPAFLARLYEHRSARFPILARVFLIGEVWNLGLAIVGRVNMWHRQHRHVIRLDCLSPPFPREQWPKVHFFFTHYMEPIEESVEPLVRALQQDYPPDRYVVNILDDSYYKRLSDGSYEIAEIGMEMEDLICRTMAARAGDVKVTRRTVFAEEREDGRPAPAPGGSSVIEFRADGLPLVRVVGRKKGPESFAKAGNLENGLWNILEEDVHFLVVMDSDMAPKPEMLQTLLPPMLAYRNGAWGPDWRTGFVSSPQDFRNVQAVWGADDPCDQMMKFVWRILPTALDHIGLVHFWGTNVGFFVPALKDAGGFVYGCMTEDLVTGAHVHRFGWKSAYVGSVQHSLAKGLCREDVLGTIMQRKRWCQGNIQQLLMEMDPPLILHDSFRYPPHRLEYKAKLQALYDGDSALEPAQALCEADCGAAERRARRTYKWKLLTGFAYFPAKFAFLFHMKPIIYYFLALTIIFIGEPPFRLTGDCFKIAGLYWLANLSANFCTYSAVLDDPDNASSPLWRTQQETYGFAWVRVIGVIEGIWSAITGKQPTWVSFGMNKDSKINMLFHVPNAVAFLFLLTLVIATLLNYFVLARYGLQVPVLCHDVEDAQVLGACSMGVLMLWLLWPVTSCIFADFLGLPYYRLSRILSTFVASSVEVSIGVLFFVAQFLR